MLSKMSIALGLLLPLLALGGCAEPPPRPPAPPPTPGMMRDTMTVHNTDATNATRIWIVRGDGGPNGGEQRVVFCDAAFLQIQGHPLCVFWPPALQPALPPR